MMDYLGWVFAGLCMVLGIFNMVSWWRQQRDLSALWIQRMMMDLLAGRRPSSEQPEIDITPNQKAALLMLAAYMRNEEYFSRLLRITTPSEGFRLDLVEIIVRPDFNSVRRRLLLSGLQDQVANRSLVTPVCPCPNPGSGHRMVMELLRKTNFQHVIPVMKKMADLHDGNGYYLAKLIEEKLVSMAEIRAYKPSIPDLLSTMAETAQPPVRPTSCAASC